TAAAAARAGRLAGSRSGATARSGARTGSAGGLLGPLVVRSVVSIGVRCLGRSALGREGVGFGGVAHAVRLWGGGRFRRGGGQRRSACAFTSPDRSGTPGVRPRQPAREVGPTRQGRTQHSTPPGGLQALSAGSPAPRRWGGPPGTPRARAPGPPGPRRRPGS